MITKERRKKQRWAIRATRPKKVKVVAPPIQHDFTYWDGNVQWDTVDNMLRAMQKPRPLDWLYNGKPALCRKCGCVWGTKTKCDRDVGHACELESATSAEERRLLEVHRRLKADFDAPRFTTAREHYDDWLSLVGLDRNWT